MKKINWKYQAKRWKVKRRTKAEKRPEMDETEIKVVDIVLHLIRDLDSELSEAPLSSEKLIENKEREMLAVITDGKVIVINSVYQYERRVSPKTKDYLVGMFRHSQEKRAVRTKRKSMSKVNKSLDTILLDMDK